MPDFVFWDKATHSWGPDTRIVLDPVICKEIGSKVVWKRRHTELHGWHWDEIDDPLGQLVQGYLFK